MVRTKKDTRKRRLGYVLGSLDRAMEHCLTIKGEFDDSLGLDLTTDDYLEKLTELAKNDTHAKLAYLLQAALTMTLQAQKLMEQFAMHSYGKVPDKVERWTQTGFDHRKKRAAENSES